MRLILFLVFFLTATVIHSAYVQEGIKLRGLFEVEPSDITYTFYNHANPNGTVVTYDQPSQSPLDANLRTYFLIHGWVDDCNNGRLSVEAKQAFLAYHDVNIVSVCWEKWSNTEYFLASTSTAKVGQFVGDFIRQLASDYDYPLSKVTIVGHSLGAHVAGYAGAATNGSIGYIVGLDPAGPNFFISDPNKRLDPTDARYVEAIHSNAGGGGLDYNVGHADFWPNGGHIQAGCFILDASCSHMRSIDLYVESIGETDNFIATKCDSYDDFTKGHCSDASKAVMGGADLDTSVQGSYYLTTNSAPPYAITSDSE